MKSQIRQSGATLIVSLIMLVVLTLLVVAAMRSTRTNLRISGNMQMKTEVSAAAQQAIEQIISTDFTANPVQKNISVNVGAASYMVQVNKPTCNSSRPVLNQELDVKNNPLDQYCLNGAGSIPLVENSDGSMASGSPSACLEQQWDVAATASDADTGAGTTLHQGIARRVEMGTSCS